ncbi:glycerate kinase [Streptomyces sp. NPDC091272]|uniref:glycerate kinase n=1 Tax=Streptomyces sp. NPDC091272 TaxID=3365981 RepID=UPI0038308589
MLVAADKFKGSLTAVEVAERVTAGLRRAVPGLEVESLPVADGGDGTVAAAVAAGFERREVRVTGPRGEGRAAAYAFREADGTAVVEMAEASGLQHLPPGVFEPLTSTTYGSGELLRAALDAGAKTIVFGVGGSATTDGGAGMLAALGARFLDADGKPVAPGGGGLRDLATVDLSGLDERFAAGGVDLVLASDVDNPLTGPVGAPAVYGPQKGASEEDVATLDAALTHYASILGPAAGRTDLADTPGAGAAGGIGYGALVALGARFRPGIEVMLDVLGFAPALERATLVVTGEGSLDEQTLHGKAPAGVAAAARARGVEVVAVCGRLALPAEALGRAGIRRAYALSALEPDPQRSMAEAGPLLERVAEQIGRDFLLP